MRPLRLPKRLQKGLSDWLWYSIRRRLLDEDLEALEVEMRGHVLELGCGRYPRRGRFEPPVDGVEKWIYLDLEDRLRPDIRANVEQLCFRDSVFDTVVCLEVFEYVTRPADALSEIRRVLKGGGTLILATPFLQRVDHPHDYWRFTDNGLRYLLLESGFDIRSLKSQGKAFAVVVNILKNAICKMQPGTLRTLMGLAAYFPVMGLFRMDERIGQRMPVWQTFSTGYLVHAVKVQATSQSNCQSYDEPERARTRSARTSMMSSDWTFAG